MQRSSTKKLRVKLFWRMCDDVNVSCYIFIHYLMNMLELFPYFYMFQYLSKFWKKNRWDLISCCISRYSEGLHSLQVGGRLMTTGGADGPSADAQNSPSLLNQWKTGILLGLSDLLIPKKYEVSSFYSYKIWIISGYLSKICHGRHGVLSISL